MTFHRFFIKPEQIQKGSVTLSGNQARQIAGVLRLSPGDTIQVLDNNGWSYELKLDSVKSIKVLGSIIKKEPERREPSLKLTLYQSLLKRDNFEWVLQKGTELGVVNFVPLITQRSIVRQSEIKKNKLARWEKIIVEAAEQSGRGRIPTIGEPLALKAVLSTEDRPELVLIPWENEKEKTIPAAVAQYREKAGGRPFSQLGIIIGPEGGFAEDEISSAREAGFIPVTLGPRILRAETAAVVAATLAFNELGELK